MEIKWTPISVVTGYHAKRKVSFRLQTLRQQGTLVQAPNANSTMFSGHNSSQRVYYEVFTWSLGSRRWESTENFAWKWTICNRFLDLEFSMRFEFTIVKYHAYSPREGQKRNFKCVIKCKTSSLRQYNTKKT